MPRPGRLAEQPGHQRAAQHRPGHPRALDGQAGVAGVGLQQAVGSLPSTAALYMVVVLIAMNIVVLIAMTFVSITLAAGVVAAPRAPESSAQAGPEAGPGLGSVANVPPGRARRIAPNPLPVSDARTPGALAEFTVQALDLRVQWGGLHVWR